MRSIEDIRPIGKLLHGEQSIPLGDVPRAAAENDVELARAAEPARSPGALAWRELEGLESEPAALEVDQSDAASRNEPRPGSNESSEVERVDSESPVTAIESQRASAPQRQRPQVGLGSDVPVRAMPPVPPPGRARYPP